tara:strand:+ start:2107 stop:2331 length:225 start_codon:yes stop_codon:yes gene_type:complete
MTFAKVKGHAHLVRDLKSQAIINTDSNAYARYMERKAKQQKKDDEIRKVVREVNELKGDIREIKDMLKGLTNGR